MNNRYRCGSNSMSSRRSPDTHNTSAHLSPQMSAPDSLPWKKGLVAMIPQSDDVYYIRKLPALEELQARPQWVCWRKEQRGGKLTKVPYSATTGSKAQSD